jgi:3'(2'), 5'-bisphosphate nucleotidase
MNRVAVTSMMAAQLRSVRASSMRDSAATDRLLPDVLALAQDAGVAIMQIYGTDFAVEHKDDHSPLTAADRAAHRIICEGLAKLTPDIPVLSEESDAATHAFETRRDWGRLWLVDPLDGTREFVSRNGEFTVNIALIEAHKPILGMVLAPALSLAYFGAVGHGCWRTGTDSTTNVVHALSPARSEPIVVGSRSHRGESLDRMLDQLGPHELKPIGSSLKFCLIADGSADFYPRLGPTSEWDTAAGQAVLESAGGRVIDLESGDDLRYNARPSLLNPHFVAFGDPGRNWQELI